MELEGRGGEENPKMPKKRGPKPKRKKKEEESGGGGGVIISEKQAPPPRTRSQVAPEWTTKESLILVNEIAAVETDCLKALSSYQKWKIIVQNCSLLDLSRTLNQCRSKWNSLLSEYNLIKQWDSKSSNNSSSPSYWLLDPLSRTRFQLPPDFDYDLFRAIDHYVRSHKDHPDTDPDTDTDPEADADLLHLIAKLGSKRHRRRSASLKIQPKGASQDCCTNQQTQIVHSGEEPHQSYKEENLWLSYKKENPPTVHGEEQPQESLIEEKSQESCRTERIHVKEKSQKSLVEEKLRNVRTQRKKISGTKEKEQLMVENLHGDAEFIHAVVQSNLPETVEFGGGDSKPQESLVVEKSKIIRTRKKKTIGTEEVMAEKLRENAELIHAIVQDNLREVAGYGNSISKSEDVQTDFIRHQGDKLISYLGDIVSILDQFPCVLQECD